MNFQIDKNVSEDFKESVPFYDAIKLTQGGCLARIILNNQIYTLRITRSGKLILTKWRHWKALQANWLQDQFLVKHVDAEI